MTKRWVRSYKSRRVVVLGGLCVAEGLQDGVGLEQLSLQLPLKHTARHRINADATPRWRVLIKVHHLCVNMLTLERPPIWYVTFKNTHDSLEHSSDTYWCILGWRTASHYGTNT